ncbi:MAG: molybdate ABC transporter substrate-binding protein [Thiotrichales bacterium]|nr:molybdate ABC transporter substrate-binding protein [Thiotrichales bacterium]
MKNTVKRLGQALGLTLGLTFSAHVYAEKATVAVAANFTKTIESVNEAFVKKHPEHTIRFSFGPTGKLFAQISNGAPFDAFFAADEKRAQKTIENGLGVDGSYFVYAQGKIALYSAKFPVANEPLTVLKQAKFNHLAIANPKTAPYGDRSQAFLQKMGLYDAVKAKIVNGESIAHAFQYVATGNADIGFVAMSQIVDPQSPIYQKGQYWVVPQADYKPINQGAVITKRGQDNAAIKDFMAFMKTPEAIKIIENYGYGVN